MTEEILPGCNRNRLAEIADRYGTPTYVYSRSAIVDRFRRYKEAMEGADGRICYAVKANGNLAILRLLAEQGAGFDIVSAGELYRVLQAGGLGENVVFSGVGKTAGEIEYALRSQIHSFNCESREELANIATVARRTGSEPSIALRVNPDVNAKTHPYISTGLREHKFGVSMPEAEEIYLEAASMGGLKPEGVSCHIGSQLLDVEPLLEATDRVIGLVRRLRSRGLSIRYLDLGGGIGVRYRKEDSPPAIEEFIREVRQRTAELDVTLFFEPGRSIIAEAGILLSRVILTKTNGAKRFVILDAGMNDLLRPALYGAYHEITPLSERQGEREELDVVGPVCETGDFVARGRELAPLETGDLVAIQTAGAYGFVLSSNYNGRPRPCEVMVSETGVEQIRKRESFDDLVRGES